MWHIKHINIRHSYSRIILVQLRSYICNSISRLFAKHTDAHHAGSARELKSYALYMYTNEKSHNACGRKWIRWKRNRSDSTDYGSRDITHKTGLHQGFGCLKKKIAFVIIALYMARYTTITTVITIITRVLGTKLNLDYVQLN